MMRGLFFRQTGSLDNLTVEELPMPTARAGEVLVKVIAAAINPSDVKNVQGKMSQTKLPRVPGRDFAGRVVSGDSHWRGRSVFGTGGNLGFGRDGSHAEFMAVPVEALVEIPPEFSDENAASIGVIYLAAFAAIVRTGEVKSGETVLVRGRWVGLGRPQQPSPISMAPGCSEL
jgi:NADPH:quinone reductase